MVSQPLARRNGISEDAEPAEQHEFGLQFLDAPGDVVGALRAHVERVTGGRSAV